MNLPVKEILAFPILRSATVKTGQRALTDRVVEWVSVIENPVENFVRENEFVLTTGIGCNQDEEQLLRFVEDVYESGASALAIATGRHVFDIPPIVSRFAEERNFILIEIPWEIRFADIVHEIMRHLMDDRIEQDERPKDIQQQLIQMILEGRTIQVIAAFIEAEIDKQVLIVNDKGEMVAGSANVTAVQSLWNEMKQNAVHVQESHHPRYSELRKVGRSGQQLYQFAIKSNGQFKGDFFILSTDENPLKRHELTIAEQAVVATSLWFSRNSAVMEAEGRMQNEFLLSLAIGKNMTTEHIQAHADLFKYDLELPYVCIVGLPENLGSLIFQQSTQSVSRKTDLEYMNSYIKDGIFYAADSINRRVLYAFKDDIILIFLETAVATTADTVNQFLDLVERRFLHLLPGVQFSWGIGKRVEGTANFKNSYQKAKAALDMGRGQVGIGKRTHFDDTQLSSLFVHLIANEEVKQILLSVISPLLAYDEGKGMDLIQTFSVYRKTSGNVSKTARELNLHRQSLLYRLRKIESLTGKSLVNPDDLFLLEFAVKLWSTGLVDKTE
ncbi:PucR family transcriptional regulator ligand-binding domain-containing protein [Sporosarcina saromensis]|uniref:PucR family transcriptional regulator ligand-binding domain-containing protein n=1 Tax=Sporosarcina saromensis TaxID=359365 RepID=A0ABU4GGV9_9BACL|nr:PucR family transcriptional regulator ligand-binding domain-containing protein [Sporosarcina saromensis]MDW0114847.1 PucR family transcriptional regulator ligand-binding domain-containing protein [Sporosarcina saromensis]